jgi:hypothetical protein
VFVLVEVGTACRVVRSLSPLWSSLVWSLVEVSGCPSSFVDAGSIVEFEEAELSSGLVLLRARS